jgi:hypothetical protein
MFQRLRPVGGGDLPVDDLGVTVEHQQPPRLTTI